MATKKAAPSLPAVRAPEQLPAEWAQRLEDEAQATAEAEPVHGKFLSLKGGLLSFNGNAIPNNRMNVVILDHILENQYFTGEYDPNQKESPACFAFGRTVADLSPHEQSTDPQQEVGKTCDNCPNMAWGSDPKGGRGKACKEVRRLAVIDAAAVAAGPEAIAKAEVVFVKIPVTSVRLWAAYVKQLSDVLHRPAWSVITDFALKPDSKSFFTANFTYVDSVDNTVIEALADKRRGIGTSIMFPYPKNVQREAPQPRKDARY